MGVGRERGGGGEREGEREGWGDSRLLGECVGVVPYE